MGRSHVAPDPLRKAVAYFVSLALVAAWIEMKREAETYRTVRRAMAALFNREKKKGMNAWADWYAEVKARRERMRTVLAGFKGGLRKAFQQMGARLGASHRCAPGSTG